MRDRYKNFNKKRKKQDSITDETSFKYVDFSMVQKIIKQII